MSHIQRTSALPELTRATTCFVIAGLLDLLMTHWLLGLHAADSEFRFVESNPVAGYFLAGWGFRGLAGYKLFMTGFVVTACWIIGSQRIDAARRILKFAAVAGVAVVGYSVSLSIRYA